MHLLIRITAKRLKDEKPVGLKVVINNVNPYQTLGEIMTNVFNNTELEIDKEEFHIYDGYNTFIE